MKEATGETNMTVVTIIIIGVIVAIATPIISNLMRDTEGKAECFNNGGAWVDGQCQQLNDM